MPFSSLGLSKKTLTSIDLLGYSTPTPIQEQAIPIVLEGRDLLAAAKTGTGKTAAFSLPAIDRLAFSQRKQCPLMLVVTPTRELAQQIGQVCQTIAKVTKHRVLTVVGGLSYAPQISSLSQGVDILIATPGRLLDLVEQKAVSLDSIETLVLDEADRMLDMGFLPAVRKIVATTPTSRQTLLFSATIDKSVMNNVKDLLRNPAVIEIAHRGETADTVEQYLIRVPQTIKTALLKAVLEEKGSQRVIVFTRTRSRAESTCRRLKRAGFNTEAIHSDRSQNQRRRALANFASGRTGILVATDVLARGIDVEEVEYVINFDLPTQAEDYVHRIGRTGRAGSQGYAVSFVSHDTEDALKGIEKFTKKPLKPLELSSFDLQEAENEAVSKTQRSDARHDPEVRQATKEENARKRRKRRAQERANAANKSDVAKSKTKKHASQSCANRPKNGQPARKKPQHQHSKKSTQQN